MSPFSLSGACLPGVLSAIFLAACSSGPKPADWQIEAKGAMERSVSAYLEGNSRVEAAELGRARVAISSTGRIDLAAKAELLNCASHVASLVFEPCMGFEKLRADAAPADVAARMALGAALHDAGLPQRALLEFEKAVVLSAGPFVNVGQKVAPRRQAAAR